MIGRIHLYEGPDHRAGGLLSGDFGVLREDGERLVGEQSGLTFHREDLVVAEHGPERREAVAGRDAMNVSCCSHGVGFGVPGGEVGESAMVREEVGLDVGHWWLVL